MTDRPDKPGYWWCQGEKDDGIWLVMQEACRFMVWLMFSDMLNEMW